VPRNTEHVILLYTTHNLCDRTVNIISFCHRAPRAQIDTYVTALAKHHDGDDSTRWYYNYQQSSMLCRARWSEAPQAGRPPVSRAATPPARPALWPSRPAPRQLRRRAAPDGRGGMERNSCGSGGAAPARLISPLK
jgi:hypothetical protein